MQGKQFDAVLGKAMDGAYLNQMELTALLDAEGAQCDRLYAAAREKRRQHFGDRLFAYGFVYFSTHCHNNCTFCFYRRENDGALRYRKTRQEILQLSERFSQSGVHLLDLTMGEDPQYILHNSTLLMELAAEVREKTELPLMISPGVMQHSSINQAQQAGIDFYACYQETHNKTLFAALRKGQNYETRWNAKRYAVQRGLLVEEGILVGVGETLEDIAHSIQNMIDLDAAQVRVMSFVPQKGAPLLRAEHANLYTRELNTLAVMRLMMPDKLIPASLDIAGKAGLRERLDAGANIVTSVIVPDSGLAGVSNATLDVDNGGRSLEGIRDVVELCGMAMGTQGEFEHVLRRLHGECGSDENCNIGREAARC